MRGLPTTGTQIKQAMRDNPPMSRAEELLVARAAVRGCQKSADRLVLCNLGIAIIRASGHQRHDGPPADDLLQCAVMGLMRAVKKFDPERGFRLSTYAHAWIRSALDRGVGIYWPLVKMPSIDANRWARTGQRNRDEPLHLSSLDSHISPGGSSLHEVVPSADRGADDELLRKEKCQLVRAAVASMNLTPREADIVRGRFMLDIKEPLGDIGLRHGVSRERIRQVEAMLLPRLRRRLAGLAA